MRAISTIIVCALVLWFAVANAASITVRLFFWQVEASLALVIGVTFLIGFLLGVWYLAPGYLAHRRTARKQAREIEATAQQSPIRENNRKNGEAEHGDPL